MIYYQFVIVEEFIDKTELKQFKEFEISVLHVKNGKLKSLDVQLLYRMLMLESK